MAGGWSNVFVVAVALPRTQQVSRRRREIFNKSAGHCHYCGATLTLDGKWHIEHKLPGALGGDNDPENLTAACVHCNLAKRDRTDVEFIAWRATQ